jgi:hypothetical protein
VSSWRGVWPRECVARCVAARADAANSPPPPIMHIAWAGCGAGWARGVTYYHYQARDHNLARGSHRSK